MKIEIDIAELIKTQASVDGATNRMVFDVPPSAVTIDGEHNLADLLLRVEMLEADVEVLENDLSELTRPLKAEK